MVTVDNPLRLSARRRAMKWVYRVKDAEGNYINVVKKLFDEIGPRYKGANGGYTRFDKLGPRRGDGGPVVILELTKQQ